MAPTRIKLAGKVSEPCAREMVTTRSSKGWRKASIFFVPNSANSAEVEGVRSWIQTNAIRKNTAPLDHPWAGTIYDYTFDGIREGIAQAPQ